MKPLPFTTLLVAAMFAFNVAAQTNKTHEVSVEVQDDSGQPIAGVALECYTLHSDSWWGRGNFKIDKQLSATTDNDGRAKLTLPLEAARIVGRKPGLAFGLATSARNLNSARITMRKPDVIAGVVVDEADKPVADAEVSISLMCFNRLDKSFDGGEVPSKYLSARTGADGSFRIEGCPAGSAMNLSVKKRGKALVVREPELSFEQMMCKAGQKDIKLRMQPGARITAKVLVPDKGYDMSQVRVMLNNEPWEPILAQPGTNGTFSLEDLLPGTHRIQARFGTNSMPEWVAETRDVTVTNGQVANVTLNAIKGGVVEIVTVSTVDNKPVGGVRIICDGQGLTDEKGKRLIRLVPGKPHMAYAMGEKPDVHRVSVKEGETTCLELRVTPPHQLR